RLLGMGVWRWTGGDGPVTAERARRFLGLPPESIETHPTSAADGRASLEVYRGLGTWIDIYDVAWRHPGTAIRRMRARGGETLYLETSNFSRGRMMVSPDGGRRFLDAAHRNDVSVVAWSLPGPRDVALDVHRS